MNKIVIFCFLPLIFLLASCGTTLKININKLELLQDDTVLTGDNSRVIAKGMIRATVISPVDLVDYAKKNRYNLWYSVIGCNSGVELTKWPYIYKVQDDNKQHYLFDFIFDYKWIDYSGRHYNLASNPEELCIVVGGASMNPFTGAKSKLTRLVLTDDFIATLRKYEQTSGEVKIVLPEECKAKMCIPDYAM